MTAVAFLLSILLHSEAVSEYATVLIYHRFDEEKYPSTSISTEDFEKHLKYLKDNNYNVIPLSQLVFYLENNFDIPPKTVVITIDDGFKSVMKGYRLLKEYNMPFTLFLSMEGIGSYPAYLTIEDIEILKADPLVEFGNHSYSHRRFAKLYTKYPLGEYKRLIMEDTLKAEEKMERILGFVPKVYAFPYGEYTKPYIEVLLSMGYTALFTQEPQNVSKQTPLWRITRQAVVGSWAKLSRFKRLLQHEVLPVIDFYPPLGYQEEPPDKVYVVLKEGNYHGCNIYVSEIGWKRAKIEGKKIYLEKLPPLTKWKNRIGVSCWNRKTKRKATYFWTIYLR
ncbi:MAG: polysaccharide deacetylase family protein [Aquificae bacterium]|nr:polysaccharide deacetylase family protein [Aquificota bacterium]